MKITSQNPLTKTPKTLSVTKDITVCQKYFVAVPSGFFARSLIDGRDLTLVPQNTYQPPTIGIKRGSQEIPIVDIGINFYNATRDIDLSNFLFSPDPNAENPVFSIKEWPQNGVIETEVNFYTPSPAIPPPTSAIASPTTPLTTAATKPATTTPPAATTALSTTTVAITTKAQTTTPPTTNAPTTTKPTQTTEPTTSTPVTTTPPTTTPAVSNNQWIFDLAPDGQTMFAWNNTNYSLYKLTEKGLKFTNLGSTAVGLPPSTMQALAISSDYANDHSLIIASANQIFLSTDEGLKFGPLTTAGMPTGFITSVDLGPDYLGGLAIVVGTSSGSSLGGSAKYNAKTSTWNNLGFPKGDIYAVALAPKYTSNAEVLVVGTNDVTFLWTKFGPEPANASISPAQIPASSSSVNKASLAFASEYDPFSNNKVFVGLGNAAGVASGDVYRVSGVPLPGISISVDLEVSGYKTNTNINSLSFRGNLSDGLLYVGLSDSADVRIGKSLGASTPSFARSLNNPSGSANTIVRVSPVDGSIFAITSGAGSALSVSTEPRGDFQIILR